MLSPRPGQAFATLHRVSGIARFQPDGDSGWLDLGDVEMHSVSAEPKRRLIERATRFGTEPRAEETTRVQFTWSLHLQEHIAATLETQFFATRQGDADLPAYDAQSITFGNAQRGRLYHTGTYNVRDVIVTVGTELFTDGVDYVVHAIAGDVELLEHGTIPAGTDVTITFDAPVARYNALSSGSTRNQKLTRKGTLRLLEFDGGEIPKSIITFVCSLSADEWGDRGVEDRTKFTLRALQLGTADYHSRALPEPTRIDRDARRRWGHPLRRLGLLRADQASLLIIR